MSDTEYNKNPLVIRLAELADELMRDSSGFLEQPDNLQLWYNRGYANGILSAFEQANIKIEGLVNPDPDDQWSEYRFLAWGQAFIHGRTKGRDETHKILKQLSK